MSQGNVIYKVYDNDASTANRMYSNGPQLVNMQALYPKSGLCVNITGVYPHPLDLDTITDQTILGRLYNKLKEHPVRRTSTLPGKYRTPRPGRPCPDRTCCSNL